MLRSALRAGFDEAGFGGQRRKKAGGTIFYGSTPETLQLLRKKVEERYPGVVISGMMSPPFREMTPQEDAQAVAEINATKPDFVWVGLGAPKQERWMAAHEDRVQALMIGVGAAFDYEAGNIKRAPMWMQKHNLEWLLPIDAGPEAPVPPLPENKCKISFCGPGAAANNGKDKTIAKNTMLYIGRRNRPRFLARCAAFFMALGRRPTI